MPYCSATALIVYVFGFLVTLVNHSNPISTRGFVEFNFEYSRSNSFVSSEITFGKVTCTSTN